MTPIEQSYLYANRKEISVKLNVKAGKIPDDIYGVVYVTSMCGSLNSQGLPIPEKRPGEDYTNPEYGTPQLAGDGMIFKIDFNYSGEVRLKTCITKPPCYFADLATDRYHSPTIDPKFKEYGFKSAGLTRASIQLGFRNELSTAIIPFQFPEDKHPRVIVTFDAGRPWEFNADTLELITPIEKYANWIKGTPPGLKFPFYLIQSSAHPTFDPVTKEFFTVNYTQQKPVTYQVAFFLLMLEHRDELRAHLKEKGKLFAKLKKSIDSSKILADIIKDLKMVFDKSQEHDRFKDLFESVLPKYGIKWEDLKMGEDVDEVFLMRWNGKQEDLKKWRVVDENGNNIAIEECMHQTSLTEDYILLADSSFKFAADLLITNPFPENPTIDKMLRALLNDKSPLDMALYVIKRSELKDNVDTVKAKRFSLPADCIHFSANYKNPGGNMTLYTINNNSVCVAEWIRPYDKLKIGGGYVYPELVGLPAMSGMDVNSLTKYVINGEKGIISEKTCQETGGPVGKVTKPHTWDICLFTYRDMIAADKPVDEIKNIYVFSAGMSSQKLTKFMFNLFKNAPDKVVPTDQVLAYTKAGVTQSLFRMETDGMTIKDYYMTDFNTEIRSLQYVPRKQERPGVEYSMNGYIFCTMMVGSNKTPNAPVTMSYSREIWIFEADNLAKGPVCKLTHPDMSFSFTLHSTWIPEAVEQESNYHISIREDFKNPESILPGVQQNIKEFFEKFIYPNFDKKPTV